MPRLSGSPRQQSWAEDLRRRAVRDLTEERANETARDALRRYRDKESAFAEEFRADLEAAIKAVGGDEAAAEILGRDILLEARECVEDWRGVDWLEHSKLGASLISRASYRVDSDRFAIIDVLQNSARKKSEKPALYTPEIDVLKDKLFRIDALYYHKLYRLEERYLLDDTAPGFQREKNRLDERRRRDYMNACFPLDDRRSPTRRALRQKTPSTTLSGNGEKLGLFSAGYVREGLDFIGRVADNMGVDASALRGVDFHDELTAARPFYTKSGITAADYLTEAGLKKPVQPNAVALATRDAKFDRAITGGDVAHEWGHALDANVPGLLDDVVAYYNELTTNEDGSRTTSDVIPGYKSEHYRKIAERFAKRDGDGLLYTVDDGEYALKHYEEARKDADGKYVFEVVNTELSSMFFQRCFENVAKYKEEHTRHFLKMLELYRQNAIKRGADYVEN